MSLHEYKVSIEIQREDYPFYSLIMAAMQKADSNNVLKLRAKFPGVWAELYDRYHSTAGHLPSDPEVKPASEIEERDRE